MQGELKLSVKAILSLLCTLPLWVQAADTANLSSFRNKLQQCSPALRQQSAVAAGAEAKIAQTQSQTLPTFAVDAGGFVYDDGDTANPVNISASLPLTTFGKQEAAEQVDGDVALLERAKIGTQTSELIQTLFDLQVTIETLKADMQVLKENTESQQALLDRINRRLKSGLSSPAEVNSVTSKIGRLKVDYGTRQTALNKAERQISSLACGQYPLPIQYQKIPLVNDGLAALEIANPKLRELSQEIRLEKRRLAYTELKTLPELGVEAVAPIDSSTDSRARLGLKIRYEYGNLGKGQAAEIEQQRLKIEASSNAYATYADELMNSQQTQLDNIKYYSSYMIPNQETTIKSLEATLASKTRLFQGGRTGLFELLSAYDELMQAQLTLNKFKSELAQYGIDVAENAGYFIE